MKCFTHSETIKIYPDEYVNIWINTYMYHKILYNKEFPTPFDHMYPCIIHFMEYMRRKFLTFCM